MKHFRGSELQNYFTKILEDNLRAIIKPQYVDHLPRQVSGKVREILAQKDELKNTERMIEDLDLSDVLDREVGQLSGGELQRFAIAVVCIQNADMYVAI